MKFKKIIAIVLMACMVFAMGTANVYAGDDTPSAAYETGKIPLIQPYSYYAIDEDLTSANGSQRVTFELTSVNAYFRVYVTNTSTKNYTVIGPDGKSATCYAGNYCAIWSTNAWPAGSYQVTVTSSDGSKLQGHIAIRVAQFLSEVVVQ